MNDEIQISVYKSILFLEYFYHEYQIVHKMDSKIMICWMRKKKKYMCVCVCERDCIFYMNKAFSLNEKMEKEEEEEIKTVTNSFAKTHSHSYTHECTVKFLSDSNSSIRILFCCCSTCSCLAQHACIHALYCVLLLLSFSQIISMVIHLFWP